MSEQTERHWWPVVVWVAMLYVGALAVLTRLP